MQPGNNRTPTKPLPVPVRVETSWKPCAGSGSSLKFPGVRPISWVRVSHPSPCSPWRARGPVGSREGWGGRAGGEQWDSVTDLLEFRVLEVFNRLLCCLSWIREWVWKHTSSCNLVETDRKRDKVQYTDINKLIIRKECIKDSYISI